MQKLKELMDKLIEKIALKMGEKLYEKSFASTDPPDGCFCGCIVPLLFWVGIIVIIGFAIYKLFF